MTETQGTPQSKQQHEPDILRHWLDKICKRMVGQAISDATSRGISRPIKHQAIRWLLSETGLAYLDFVGIGTAQLRKALEQGTERAKQKQPKLF